MLYMKFDTTIHCSINKDSQQSFSKGGPQNDLFNIFCFFNIFFILTAIKNNLPMQLDGLYVQFSNYDIKMYMNFMFYMLSRFQ